MKRKLVIHIGLRKTGSSALQEIVARESNFLLEYGIHYPDRIIGFPAHQELAWSLMSPPPPYFNEELPRDEVFDHYCTVIDANSEKGLTTVLSSEDFSLLTFNYEALEYLKSRLAQYEPLVVFFARNPISYHISNYKHSLISRRETRAFVDYVFDVEELLFASSPIIQNIWAGIFGSDRILVLKYDPSTFQKKSIFAYFLEKVFDLEIEDHYKNFRSNTGIPNEAVDFVRALNRSEINDDELKEAKGAVSRIGLPTDDEAFLVGQLSPEELAILRKLHGAS
ncbi:hypothetical protein [Donghicola sp. XS_ASV15]|uniref:hypothetical protein n=1 Tax=Donghicola sp. XS_ASV15 TaxID=3241295 RepID=UPI003519B6DF